MTSHDNDDLKELLLAGTDSGFIRRELAHSLRLTEQKNIMYGKGFRLGVFTGACATGAATIIILMIFGVIT